MKIKSLFAALVVLAGIVAACSADTNPVVLTGTPALDATCKPASNLNLESGSLDISATNQYFLALNWESTVTPTTTTVNGQPIDTPNQFFFVDQAQFTYKSNPSASFASEAENLSAVLSSGSAGSSSFLIVDPLQPKALATLQTIATPGGPPVEWDVTVQIKGHFQDGASVNTNKITFPIRVVNSGFTGCPAGQVQVPPTTCGNFGQDQSSLCADAGA